MNKAIQLHPGMGAAILAHLGKLQALPASGVIAGQAVASAIDDLFGKGGGVYNDLDVFRRVHRPDRQLRRTLENNTVAQVFPGLPNPDYGENDHYNSLVRCLQQMRSYTVGSVSRQGLLNYVNCREICAEFEDGRLLPLVPERLLASFDLNCVRVAVDIESQRLAWLPQYERFLATRQLEIVCLQTPFHTFLRLLKKLSELSEVYADVEAAAEAATALFHSQRYDLLKGERFVVSRFGSKLQQLALATEQLWAPYFSLQEAPTKDPKAKLFTLNPKGQASAAAQEAVDRLSVNSIHYAARAVYRVRRRHAAQTTQRAADLVATTDPKGFVHAHALQLAEEYVQGQFSPTHVDTVERYVDAHVELWQPLSGLTLDAQYRIVLDLKRIERTYGRAAIALVRHKFVAEELVGERFETFVQQRMLALGQPFTVTPLKLPALPPEWQAAGYRVEELLTPATLMEEGETMRHCVGGYASSIKQHHSRILRIRTGNNAKQHGSTVELRIAPVFRQRCTTGHRIPGVALKNVQHRSYCNGKPEIMHEAIVQYVLAGISTSWQERARWWLLNVNDWSLQGMAAKTRQLYQWHIAWPLQRWWRSRNGTAKQFLGNHLPVARDLLFDGEQIPF